MSGREAVAAMQRARALAGPVVPHSQENLIRQRGEPPPAHDFTGMRSVAPAALGPDQQQQWDHQQWPVLRFLVHQNRLLPAASHYGC